MDLQGTFLQTLRDQTNIWILTLVYWLKSKQEHCLSFLKFEFIISVS